MRPNDGIRNPLLLSAPLDFADVGSGASKRVWPQIEAWLAKRSG